MEEVFKTKICTGRWSCGQTKILELFYKDSTSPDGHLRHCIECQKNVYKSRRQKILDYHKKRNIIPEIRDIHLKYKKDYNSRPAIIRDRKIYHRQYYKNHIEKWILKTAKARARETSIEFNIEEKDIIIPRICPVLNIPIIVSEFIATINSPSLDRIDNTQGYIKGNIQVISHLANSMKNEATPEQIIAFSEWGLNTYKKYKHLNT